MDFQNFIEISRLEELESSGPYFVDRNVLLTCDCLICMLRNGNYKSYCSQYIVSRSLHFGIDI